MKSKGISLIEILIATAILLSSMVPLWGLMDSSHHQVIRSSDEIKASQLTVEILEQLENYYNTSAFISDGTGDAYEKKVDLTPNSSIEIQEGYPPIKIGEFDEYLKPSLTIEVDLKDKEVGCIVSVELGYTNKEGRELNYILRGYVSAYK